MTTIPLLAQGAFALTIAHWCIIAIIVAGIVGILFIAAQQAGIPIPPFVVTIFWIVVCCFIAVVAIKLLMGML